MDRKRLFVAFEGGGAKGLVHIGALSAMEEREFQFRGIAGTSAGSIIAALKAVGYTSNDLYNLDNDQNVLQLLCSGIRKKVKITDLFGPMGWNTIILFQFLYKSIISFKVKAIVILLLFYLLVFCSMYTITKDYNSLKNILSLVSVILACGIVVLVYASNRIFKGLTSLDTFRKDLNSLLAFKVSPTNPHKEIRMHDINKSCFPVLKIVAADISSKSLRLFASNDPKDAQVCIADAVAASISLPIVFKPWKIGSEVFIDGGIVSNLPIWPFDVERALDPESIAIAVEIKEFNNIDVSRENVPTNSLVMAAVQTALFGASVLNTRAVHDLSIITLATDLHTLEFDAPKQKIRSTIEDSKKAAQHQIRKEIFEKPNLYRDGCISVRDVMTEMAGILLFRNSKDMTRRVRVSVAVKEDEQDLSLRIKYCIGFEHDFDANVLLPINESVVGRVWRESQPLLLARPLSPEDDLLSPASRNARRVVPHDLEWFFAVPIFAGSTASAGDSRPNFVVAIDGSGKFDADANLDAAKSIMCAEVERIFIPIARALGEKNV